MSKPGTNHVDLEIRPDNVAVVTLDHFPLNTLSNAIQLGLEDASEKIQANKNVVAVVLKGAGTRSFCAGADVVDLNKKHERYPKKAFYDHFEPLNIPVVAALQGFTLGGGLELALSTHYRVATKTTFVGLPECNIGLLPGGQGTQRLPRLCANVQGGLEASLNVMLTGEHIPAKAAAQFGIIDKVVEGDLVEEAVAFGIEMAKKNKNNVGRRISQLPPPAAPPGLFDKARSQMRRKRKGQPAPLKIIDCVEAACTQEFAQGIKVEAKLFGELLGSKEANALQYVFFGERAAAKVPGLKEKPAKIKNVGVIGCGLMGAGIGMCCTEVGMNVTFIDRDEKSLEKGMSVIKANYARSVKRKSKSQAQVEKSMSKMKTSVDYGALKDCDIVIEAVFEDMDLKKEIFKKLDSVCNPNCILATNTSFLSIDEIASVTKRPELVVGCHFFSPSNVMVSLENIRGSKTNGQTIATVMAFGSKIGKWPVLVGNCHGFVANRMMSNYGTEARAMLMQNDTTPMSIDKVATDYGLPLGPFSLTDLTGLKIGYEARLKKGLVDPERILQDWLIQQGREGMKTGAGFYTYNKDRTRSVDQSVLDRILVTRKNLGVENPSPISEQEIRERLLFPIVNEGFRILEEGIVYRPVDIDVVLVHGYNWPRVTGGPMRWADDVGLENVLRVLQKLEASNPKAKYLKPSQLLVDCVKSGQPLATYWAKNSSKYLNKTNSKL